MPRRSLPHLEVLKYALEGATTRRGVMSGNLSADEEDELDADIQELERRIKQAEAKNQQGEKP
jgi:hypothetical protein